MLLYYAMGGGLGHLTRARAFLHTLGLAGEAALLTASPFAADPRVTGGLPLVRVPEALDGDRAALREFVLRALAERRATRLAVDAFPAGLLGELAGFVPPPGVEMWHVARLLRWERYAAETPDPLPRYDVTFVAEELHPEHRRALEEASREVREIALEDPPAPEPEPLAKPYALVVHAGPDAETLDLVACARELGAAAGSAARLVLVAPRRPEELPADVAWLDLFPATELFAGAERIVCAAGFNAVRQTEPFREKRFVAPYPRRFDDPFTRAARARRGSMVNGGFTGGIPVRLAAD